MGKIIYFNHEARQLLQAGVMSSPTRSRDAWAEGPQRRPRAAQGRAGDRARRDESARGGSQPDAATPRDRGRHNALSGEFGDLFEDWVIDPLRVTRLTIQHAASVAALMLTTEALVAEELVASPAR